MGQRAVGGCHQPLHVMARLAVVGSRRLALDRLEHCPRPDGRNELYLWGWGVSRHALGLQGGQVSYRALPSTPGRVLF